VNPDNPQEGAVDVAVSSLYFLVDGAPQEDWRSNELALMHGPAPEDNYHVWQRGVSAKLSWIGLRQLLGVQDRAEEGFATLHAW
jgi:hypothetical protein